MLRSLLAPARCVALSLMTAAYLSAAEPTAWISLFNGKDLAGWTAPSPNPFWRVENGVLIGESDEKLTGSMLRTERKFRDFVLELDARWQGDPDSGVFVREPSLQIQIGTSISQKRDFTGSFYLGKEGYAERAQAKDAAKLLKRGDWNTLRVEARGDTFKVSINGKPASQFTDPKYAGAGPIGVQIHAKLQMKIEFRNIRIAELK
jgi:hypothetical protein